jgi:hypothetical protein
VLHAHAHNILASVEAILRVAPHEAEVLKELDGALGVSRYDDRLNDVICMVSSLSGMPMQAS